MCGNSVLWLLLHNIHQICIKMNWEQKYWCQLGFPGKLKETQSCLGVHSKFKQATESWALCVLSAVLWCFYRRFSWKMSHYTLCLLQTIGFGSGALGLFLSSEHIRAHLRFHRFTYILAPNFLFKPVGEETFYLAVSPT